jgi:hypothetical protein
VPTKPAPTKPSAYRTRASQASHLPKLRGANLAPRNAPLRARLSRKSPCPPAGTSKKSGDKACDSYPVNLDRNSHPTASIIRFLRNVIAHTSDLATLARTPHTAATIIQTLEILIAAGSPRITRRSSISAPRRRGR